MQRVFQSPTGRDTWPVLGREVPEFVPLEFERNGYGTDIIETYVDTVIHGILNDFFWDILFISLRCPKKAYDVEEGPQRWILA